MDPLVARIVRELQRMTLAEADALGTRLDAEHGGAGSEFALYPVQREVWGIAEAEKVYNTYWPAVELTIDSRDRKLNSMKRGAAADVRFRHRAD